MPPRGAVLLRSTAAALHEATMVAELTAQRPQVVLAAIHSLIAITARAFAGAASAAGAAPPMSCNSVLPVNSAASSVVVAPLRQQRQDRRHICKLCKVPCAVSGHLHAGTHAAAARLCTGCATFVAAKSTDSNSHADTAVYGKKEHQSSLRDRQTGSYQPIPCVHTEHLHKQ